MQEVREKGEEGREAPVQRQPPSFKIVKPSLIVMSGKMKDNPGSGQIWNLIVGVFRAEAAPNCPIIFCIEYILWRQQWTATAAYSRTAPR